MKTIDLLKKKFKGRFVFTKVTVRGATGYKVVDTYRMKTYSIIGGDEDCLLKDLEHQCWRIVKNESN